MVVHPFSIFFFTVAKQNYSIDKIQWVMSCGLSAPAPVSNLVVISKSVE